MIMLGIETGSERMQDIIKKRLNLSNVSQIVGQITNAGINFAASFIIGFPEERLEDLKQSINLIGNLRFAGKGDRVLALHVLAPAPGTELFHYYKQNLRFDGSFSDIADAELDDENCKLISEQPDIFPGFYYYESPFLIA